MIVVGVLTATSLFFLLVPNAAEDARLSIREVVRAWRARGNGDAKLPAAGEEEGPPGPPSEPTEPAD